MAVGRLELTGPPARRWLRGFPARVARYTDTGEDFVWRMERGAGRTRKGVATHRDDVTKDAPRMWTKLLPL